MSKGLFLGLITLDIQFFINSYPGANEKVKAKDYGVYAGGPACNAAITHSWIGGRAKLISSLGENEFTGFITKDLEKCKIELHDLSAGTEKAPIFASVITSEPKGDRTIFSYHPPKAALNSFNTDKILHDIDFVFVDGFYINEAITLAKEAKSNAIPVIMDGGSWKENTDELLKHTDILIASANFKPPGTKNTFETINYLHQKGVKKVAITRGNQKILCSINHQQWEIPVPKINAIDTLGAGDIFHGAFCYFYTQNLSFEECLQKSAEIAALSCQSKGTRNWMALHKHLEH